jgi:hypothetical protein
MVVILCDKQTKYNLIILKFPNTSNMSGSIAKEKLYTLLFSIIVECVVKKYKTEL